MTSEWSLLIYKLPAHPSKHRLSVWRKLVAIGAVYLQDGVCTLPKRDDLDENLQYVADQIAASGGTYHLLEAASSGAETEKLTERFRLSADERMRAQLIRLQALLQSLEEIVSIADIERAEDELKKERVAFLKSNRLSFLGSNDEPLVTARLDEIRAQLDILTRGAK